MDFIATILRVGRCRVRIPAEARNYYLLQNVQACFAVHAASYTMTVGFFNGLKRSGRKADCSPPFNSRIRKEYRYMALYLNYHFAPISFWTCIVKTRPRLFFPRSWIYNYLSFQLILTSHIVSPCLLTCILLWQVWISARTRNISKYFLLFLSPSGQTSTCCLNPHRWRPSTECLIICLFVPNHLAL